MAEALEYVWQFLNDCMQQNTHESGKAKDALRGMRSTCIHCVCPCLSTTLYREDGTWATLESQRRWLPHWVPMGMHLRWLPRWVPRGMQLREEWLPRWDTLESHETDLERNDLQMRLVEIDMTDENLIEALILEHRQQRADAGNMCRKLDQIRATDKNAMGAIRSLAKFQDFHFNNAF